MFTHARSAAASGQGTEVNTRGLALNPQLAAGTLPLLTVEQGLDNFPVRVSIKIINKVAYVGGNPSIVVQAVPAAGGAPVTIATGTFGASDVVSGEYLAYGKDVIEVVWSPGTTSGQGAVFAELSGLGAP